MEARPLPRAAVPGQVSKRCRGGDSSLLYRRRSLPCHMRAPVHAYTLTVGAGSTLLATRSEIIGACWLAGTMMRMIDRVAQAMAWAGNGLAMVGLHCHTC